MRNLLAHLLCYGVCPDQDVLGRWATLTYVDRGFIHGVTFRIANRHLVNTAILERMVKPQKALRVKHFESGDFLDYEGDLVSCEPIPQPDVVFEKVGDYIIGEYVRLHGPRTIFLTPVRECIFIRMGQGCQFCTFKGSKPRPLPFSVLEEMVRRMVQALPGDSFDAALGGGTPNLRDHGARYYSELAARLHSRFGLLSSVEIVPPQEPGDLELLFREGVGSLVMSIEVWDDDIRSRVCPGKSVVPKSRYIQVWQRALEALGPGKVSSVLIVGLEPPESTREGIKVLTSMGVLPTLIPFRPYDGIPLESHALTEPGVYLELSSVAAIELRRRGLAPATHDGCAACGGCSLERFFSEFPEDATGSRFRIL